jgi:hypothetical protein
MAKVYPDAWKAMLPLQVASGELQTLHELADGLPKNYTIYHGVHWTRIEKNNFAIFGEIDFAIVGPTGKLLLIEKKAGLLTETAEGLKKNYSDKAKSVSFQLARNTDALHSRLRQICGSDKTYIDSLLYCPHYTVKNPGSAGIDPSRIVDASKAGQLISIIQSILPLEGETLAAKSKIHAFLIDLLELVPEVNAIVGQTGALYTRLSGGLAEWARKIDCQPFRLRVIGTAGSGKTQLALAAFTQAIKEGRRPLYVCYNRPLADHMAKLVPPGGQVSNYHQLGTLLCATSGHAIDFHQPDPFKQIETAMDHYQPATSTLFDELIVDEGQDFVKSWANNLLRLIRPEARAWWLEDPLQNLYNRESLTLPGWVSLHSDTNFRSPRQITHTLNQLLALPQSMQSGSPLEGHEVEYLTYLNPQELITKTVTAINKCIGAGFKREHICVLSLRGREHSKLSALTSIGPYSLCAPTGQYDLFGNPIFSQGDILCDSVYRFKGRASPCVVLTEIDFERLDESTQRRIFVGATRATIKLVMVMSDNAAKTLQPRLD